MAEPGDARALRSMPRAEPPALPPQRLCASAELEEKGKALLFDVLHFHEPQRAFALRFEGRVVAYLNRCVHVPTEMDWQPGEFLDSAREFILCSIHGAAYDPRSGHCLAGPCGRGKLAALQALEKAGSVFWQPTRDTRPAAPVHPTPPPV